MVHKCNIHCHDIDPEKMHIMGMDDNENSTWMPFCFHMGIVIACKLSDNEVGGFSYNCTTVYTEQGDTYSIDTPYREFEEKFIRFNDNIPSDNREIIL